MRKLLLAVLILKQRKIACQKSHETETESDNGGGFNDQIFSDFRAVYGEIGDEVSGSEFYDEYGYKIGESEPAAVPPSLGFSGRVCSQGGVSSWGVCSQGGVCSWGWVSKHPLRQTSPC